MRTPTTERTGTLPRSYNTRPATWGLASLALLSIVVYLSTLLNYWVADDYNYIVHKSLDRVLAFYDPSVPSRAFYRPVNWTTWAVDFALWGKSPAGWHLSNILINTVACLAVALLAHRLFKNWTVALLAGAFFAAHPTHTETVSFVGGRADEICGMFYFASLLLFVVHLQRRAARRPHTALYVLSFVSALAALLSKETGATLPLALLLTDAFFFTPPGKLLSFAYWRNRIVAHLPFLELIGGYAAIRYYLISSGQVTNTFSGPSQWSLQGLLDAAAGNVMLAAGVWGGPRIASTLPNGAKVLLVLAALAACVAVVRFLGKPAVYCLLWIVVTILPTANLSSARWLYIPSFGICLLAALLIDRLANILAARYRQSSRVPYLLAGALILLWASAVLYLNVQWYRSGEEARSILAQIKKLVPDPPNGATIYFAGAPYYYRSVYLFNTGLPAALPLIYDSPNIELHEVEQPLPDPVINDALADPPKLRPNSIFLGYKNGEVRRYPSFHDLVQSGTGKQ
jgi:hypothetical protein